MPIRNYPSETINTPLGLLKVIFMAADSVLVQTINDDYHYENAEKVIDPGQPFVLRGVRYSVDTLLHPKGACKTFTSRGSDACHLDHAYGWDLGRVRHPDSENPHFEEGSIEPYSPYLYVKRIDGKSFSLSADKAIRELVLRQVNLLLRRTASALAEGERVNLFADMERARQKYEKIQEQLASAVAEWQLAEDKLAEFDRRSEAA